MLCPSASKNATHPYYLYIHTSTTRPTTRRKATALRLSSFLKRRVMTRERLHPRICVSSGPLGAADVTTLLAHVRRCLSPFLPPPLAPSPPRRSSPRRPPRYVSFLFMFSFRGRFVRDARRATRIGMSLRGRRRLGLLASATRACERVRRCRASGTR